MPTLLFETYRGLGGWAGNKEPYVPWEIPLVYRLPLNRLLNATQLQRLIKAYQYPHKDPLHGQSHISTLTETHYTVNHGIAQL